MLKEGWLLLVDDDDDVRESLSDLLQRRGHRVRTARDGQRALETIRENDPPCLIICDLMMPEMDGWELCKTLRADPVLSAVPLVVFSGVSDVERMAGEIDAVAHLKKPLDLAQLYRVVDTYC